jgi:glucan phosphoethanolaminetransferase (alkaline phosphatase superfamily)
MIRERRFLPGAILLVVKVLLIAAGLYLTNHQVIARLVYFLDFRLYFPLLVFLGAWVCALIAIFYIAFTPRIYERLAWSFVICLTVVLAETYYLVTDDRLTIGALDAMWDPDSINAEIAAFYGSYFLEALVHTAVLLAGLLLPVPAKRLLKWRGLAAAPLIPLLLLCGLVYYGDATGGNETRGMPSPFLAPGVFGVFALSSPPEFEKSPVDIPLSSPTGLQNIIVIVDESVNGDFIDLNVARGTTPFLLSRAESMANFGLAVSASNCSNASNAILRLGGNPDTLGSDNESVFSNPSIWKYANKAGFETHFVEAQNLSKHNHNFMNRAEIDLIDHISTVPDDIDGDQRDMWLIGQIGAILTEPRPQFIYANKFGVHFPYLNSYPAGETVFSPAMQPYETIADRERLVNTYKNAIHWSVDHFFEQLLGTIDLSNSVLIYTSDHGQNLLDDGQPTTHCRRVRESLYEAVVPLLVWTGNDEFRQKFFQAAQQNYGRVSHFEIFPTVLELLGYDQELVKRRYHQGFFEKIDEPLGFTSGPIMGRFGWQATWHSRDGLDQLQR